MATGQPHRDGVQPNHLAPKTTALEPDPEFSKSSNNVPRRDLDNRLSPTITDSATIRSEDSQTTHFHEDISNAGVSQVIPEALPTSVANEATTKVVLNEVVNKAAVPNKATSDEPVVGKSTTAIAILDSAFPDRGHLQRIKHPPKSSSHLDAKTMESALVLAADAGLDTMVEQLLDMGVDPNTLDVLQKAAWNGHFKTWQLLLGLVADPNAPNVIQKAAWNGHIAVVQLLLNAGVDTNVAGRTVRAIADYTALQAWPYGPSEAVLDRGQVDPNLYRANINETLMRGRGSEGMVKLLLDAGADPNTPHLIQRVARNGHIAMVQLLLDAGVDPSVAVTTVCAFQKQLSKQLQKLVIWA